MQHKPIQPWTQMASLGFNLWIELYSNVGSTWIRLHLFRLSCTYFDSLGFIWAHGNYQALTRTEGPGWVACWLAGCLATWLVGY